MHFDLWLCASFTLIEGINSATGGIKMLCNGERPYILSKKNSQPLVYGGRDNLFCNFAIREKRLQCGPEFSSS